MAWRLSLSSISKTTKPPSASIPWTYSWSSPSSSHVLSSVSSLSAFSSSPWGDFSKPTSRDFAEATSCLVLGDQRQLAIQGESLRWCFDGRVCIVRPQWISCFVRSSGVVCNGYVNFVRSLGLPTTALSVGKGAAFFAWFLEEACNWVCGSIVEWIIRSPIEWIIRSPIERIIRRSPLEKLLRQMLCSCLLSQSQHTGINV